MSNVELKPCVCGGNAVKIKIFSHKRYDCLYKCDKCEWQTKVYVSPQGAKNAWNRRVDNDRIVIEEGYPLPEAPNAEQR